MLDNRYAEQANPQTQSIAGAAMTTTAPATTEPTPAATEAHLPPSDDFILTLSTCTGTGKYDTCRLMQSSL